MRRKALGYKAPMSAYKAPLAEKSDAPSRVSRGERGRTPVLPLLDEPKMVAGGSS